MGKKVYASVVLNVTYEDCTETLTDGDMLSEVVNTLNEVIKERLVEDSLVSRNSRMIVLNNKASVNAVLSEDVEIEFVD